MSYNLLGLRDRVRAKIKDSSYPSSNIDGFINDAQIEIADLHTWKFFEKVVSGTLTIGEYTYEQQTDHQLTTKLVLINPSSTTSNWDITKHYKTSQKFFDIYPAPEYNNNLQPCYWTEYGGQIYFQSPVDLAYILKQFYQKVPTELTADADVPELPINFREALVLGATYRCEEERENHDIAAAIQNRFNDRISDLMLKHANTTLAGPDTVVMPGIVREDY